MIIRDFLPVGQGAFYHEKFSINSDYINIIYDCGSATNIDIIEKQITDNFSKDEVIHAVFISHLDEDHINGLPFLLQHCIVKNIFFPLVSKIDSIYLQISQSIEYSGNIPLITFLLNNFRKAIKEMSGDKDVNTNLRYIGNRDEISEEDLQILSSGTDVSNIVFGSHYPLRDWVLIPYNFRHDERLKQLKINLNNCFGKDMDNKDLKEVWENGGEAEREKIKNCHRAIKGSFNTNSMTLYSGMRKNVLIQSFPCDFYSNYMCFLKYKSSGAMYLGDYDLSGKYKREEFQKAYELYWENIGCIQIPYHGSKHNYNSELVNLDAYYIVSAGKKNKYMHPHCSVVKDLLINGHFPHIVTEDEVSQISLRIDI